MNLAEVFGPGWPSTEVEHLVEHTGEVHRSCAFFAAAADKHDAQRHGEAALKAGASIVVSQHELELPAFFRFPGLAEQRGALAAHFYNKPAQQLECIGVTGTNGKTSVAYYIASLSDLLGVSCGYVGTLGWGVISDLVDPNMTTPNPVALQRCLAALVKRGCKRVAIEVSSHALDQGRAAEVPFRIAVFTNLTRDHLDYHGTWEAYAAAKLKLFTDFPLASAVLSLEDSFSDDIASQTHASVVRYGKSLSQQGGQPHAHAWCWQRQGASELTLWSVADQQFEANVAGVADFTFDNVTAALAVCAQLGHAFEKLASVVASLAGVPGRMEVVAYRTEHGTVVVDYAHTPDALAKALSALRPACQGQLICIVGCGGDRDRGKRPQMAAAASQLADRIWLTSDNPRTEAPERIIDDMKSGISSNSAKVDITVDRREAIRGALTNATVLDVVLIAGKGHEDYQEVGNRKYPFDDAAVARALLGEM